MIKGTTLRDAIISASNNIYRSKQHVDELNIFPVPDGDTGTNMSMTIGASAREVTKVTSDRIGDCAEANASAMLRGARGNSGVILSLLFRGFSKGLKGKDEADGADMAAALAIGVDAAYKAVMKPTEGTMLTVARVGAERGAAAARVNSDAITVWEAICDGAREALAQTPELLPVLKKAGVVDAGGKGLVLIFEGMLSVFRDGVMIKNDEPASSEPLAPVSTVVAEWEGEITFTYCTEFIVGRDKENPMDPMDLRDFLDTIGDSLVVVDDEEIIKVHVHTDDPGIAMQEGLKYGSLITIKVENMREQKAAAEAAAEAAKPKIKWAEPVEEFGFVAVAAGKGICTLFTDLGCQNIVSGGQTMNPSTEDILRAIEATPARTVYVFPNNKNIVLAAQQTVALADRTVIVVPTKTVPQGLSAILSFDDSAAPEENLAHMMRAADGVATGQVTFAARNSDFDGHKIREGEIISLHNGKLVFTDKTPARAVVKLARAMIKRSSNFITLIYGEDVTEQEAESVKNSIQSKLSDGVEITLINGGQPIYYYIISVE